MEDMILYALSAASCSIRLQIRNVGSMCMFSGGRNGEGGAAVRVYYGYLNESIICSVYVLCVPVRMQSNVCKCFSVLVLNKTFFALFCYFVSCINKLE